LGHLLPNSAFFFEFSPILGREEPPLSAYLYKHLDGNPSNIIPILMKSWKVADESLRTNKKSWPLVPVSVAQVVLGLLLADTANEFRFSESNERMEWGYFYRFRQHTQTEDRLVLSIIAASGTSGPASFEGDLTELTEFWKRNKSSLE
jgi:hypothetical protein